MIAISLILTSCLPPKIPCSVTFDVNTFNGFASDGQDESAFVVSPPSYQIPPLECIYVNVSFSPTAMKVSFCHLKKIVYQFQLILILMTFKDLLSNF